MNPLVPRARCVILISGKERGWCLYPYNMQHCATMVGFKLAAATIIFCDFTDSSLYIFLFFNYEKLILLTITYFLTFIINNSSLLPGSCLTLLRYCLNIFSRPFRSGLSTDMCISKRPGRNMALNQKIENELQS